MVQDLIFHLDRAITCSVSEYPYCSKLQHRSHIFLCWNVGLLASTCSTGGIRGLGSIQTCATDPTIYLVHTNKSSSLSLGVRGWGWKRLCAERHLPLMGATSFTKYCNATRHWDPEKLDESLLHFSEWNLEGTDSYLRILTCKGLNMTDCFASLILWFYVLISHDLDMRIWAPSSFKNLYKR